MPKPTVASNSRVISLTETTFDSSPGLILNFQSPSQRQVMFYGFTHDNNKIDWIWRNITNDVNSALAESYPDFPDIHTAVTCSPCYFQPNNSVTKYQLYCFVKYDYKTESVRDGGLVGIPFYVDESSPGNITIGTSKCRISFIWMLNLMDGALAFKFSSEEDKYNQTSDIAFFSDPIHGGCQAAYIYQSKLHFFTSHPGSETHPLPDSRFPFNHLAWERPWNTTSTYLFHQLSGSIIAEEVWDEDTGIWNSTNITIDAL